MNTYTITRVVSARLPTPHGTFQLILYKDTPNEKEHVALVFGDVSARNDVLVRMHSECFTGDIFGSRRCDCGEQLNKALEMIAHEGRGILLYLRQEGRGIGLAEKLRAYNLQDIGFDTVDANLLLGHGIDERDYTAAAEILNDLEVASVRLLTNNPEKIAALKRMGIVVSARIPLHGSIHAENKSYIAAKIQKMNHLPETPQPSDSCQRSARPYVTVSYAQSLDGSIAALPGKRLSLSGKESLKYIHQLRSEHDAILIGIGTVLADNPRLTVRYVKGNNPRPIVVDSTLRFPTDAYLLKDHPLRPWIAADTSADRSRWKTYEDAGARIIPLPRRSDGYLDLEELLKVLYQDGIRTVMVEGGARIIASFLSAKLVDRMVITVAPVFVGGVPVLDSIETNSQYLPRLVKVSHRRFGSDMIIDGEPAWEA